MKTSVPIIGSILAGTLVGTLFLLGGRSAEPVVAPANRSVAVRELQPVERSYELREVPPVERTRSVPTRPRTVPSRADSSARISIPRIGLKAEIGSDLDAGPIWWPVTGRPGGGDTIAVAGHRTTYTRPFYWLERLRPGDPIHIRWNGQPYTYRVSGRRILSAKNLHIADARGHEILLLSACTPRGSARQRIVVYAWPEDDTTKPSA